MFSSLLALGAGLVATGFAQTTDPRYTSTTQYNEPTVPTGTPVPGNYTGGLRPQVHYSPPQNFMNDPNGLFKDDMGIWHLYYQYDATGIRAGNQHWGHATSKDLYHWINQKIAIYPTNNDSYIFSGSAVIDPNNTSGFFPNQKNGVVAIYTVATYYPTEAGPQNQNIAYSRDGGYTFTPYSGNPVLFAPNPLSSQFRDPKVLRYGDHWVMVVAFAQEFVIGFYTSPDLKHWSHASNFSHHGLLGLQYECPNLVEIPVLGSKTNEMLWLLQISINPGAPLGGSTEQYFPGSFNGTHFVPVDSAARLNDFGKDRYAGAFFSNTPGEAISISWASNWEYSQDVPTGPLEHWRSSMTVARKNYIANVTRIGYDLVEMPYDLTPIIGATLGKNSSFGNGSVAVDFSSSYSQAIYYQANITGLGTSPSGTMNVSFISPASGEILQSGYYFGGDSPFFVNRGGIRGFDNVFFTDKVSAAIPVNAAGTSSIEGIFDRTIFEVWADSGSKTATTTFFPNQPLTLMSMAFAGLPPGAKVSFVVYELKSVWQGQENAAGTVVGNVTQSGTNGNGVMSSMTYSSMIHSSTYSA